MRTGTHIGKFSLRGLIAVQDVFHIFECCLERVFFLPLLDVTALDIVDDGVEDVLDLRLGWLRRIQNLLDVHDDLFEDAYFLRGCCRNVACKGPSAPGGSSDCRCCAECDGEDGGTHVDYSCCRRVMIE